MAPAPGPTWVGDELLFPGLAEALRRAALGLVALLIVARAYYPSEDAESGTGLIWLLCVLGVAGLGVVANLLNGATRFRWSWADPVVLALILLVAASSGHAPDRRPAITMAWEWGGLGLLYFLARNLPRSRGESATLAAVVVATGVAVAAYGLYQTAVEFPRLRALFVANPAAMMARVGVIPGTPTAQSFAHRLMDSNEPFSTFALANSLAGFLLGPLVILLAVALENLRRDGRGGRWPDFLLAAAPALILLVCLLLTKSRSAWAGLGVAALILSWQYRAMVSRRVLLGGGLIGGLALLGLVGAGVASGRLDVQILTEARKSLGYRWEYWAGTWGIITDAPPPFASSDRSADMLGGGEEAIPRSSRPFWWGVGVANFAGPYLRHKLPAASEEIKDPHNLILEVWAESGAVAMLALVVGLGVGVASILARSRPGDPAEDGPSVSKPAPAGDRHGWLIVMGGLGWFGVWMLGQLDPVSQNDMLMRWVVLGAAWLVGVLLLAPIWSRRPIPAVGLGAAVVGLTVHLLAAGGIGIPSVALALWVLLALGLNLRDDRPCGRPREAAGLGPGVALACGWAVLAGTFYGAVEPGWRSDLALAQGEAAMVQRPPRYEVARNAFAEAIELDRYSVRPWLALADLEYGYWRSPEAGEQHKTAWTRVSLALDKALEGPYRDPNNLAIRRLQGDFARQILANLPADTKPFELVGLRGTIAKAARNAVRLYPTSAELRGRLAQASADLGRSADAAAEARVALQLDGLTPHLDKKLSPAERAYLQGQIPAWDEQARSPAPTAIGK